MRRLRSAHMHAPQVQNAATFFSLLDQRRRSESCTRRDSVDLSVVLPNSGCPSHFTLRFEGDHTCWDFGRWFRDRNPVDLSQAKEPTDEQWTLLGKIALNARDKPDAKFRTLRASNDTLRRQIFTSKVAIRVLVTLGFDRDVDGSDSSIASMSYTLPPRRVRRLTCLVNKPAEIRRLVEAEVRRQKAGGQQGACSVAPAAGAGAEEDCVAIASAGGLRQRAKPAPGDGGTNTGVVSSSSPAAQASHLDGASPLRPPLSATSVRPPAGVGVAAPSTAPAVTGSSGSSTGASSSGALSNPPAARLGVGGPPPVSAPPRGMGAIAGPAVHASPDAAPRSSGALLPGSSLAGAPAAATAAQQSGFGRGSGSNLGPAPVASQPSSAPAGTGVVAPSTRGFQKRSDGLSSAAQEAASLEELRQLRRQQYQQQGASGYMGGRAGVGATPAEPTGPTQQQQNGAENPGGFRNWIRGLFG